MNNDSVFKITEKSDNYRQLVRLIMTKNKISEAEAKAVIKKADLYDAEKEARLKAEAKAQKAEKARQRAEAKLKEKQKEENFPSVPSGNISNVAIVSMKVLNGKEDPNKSIERLNSQQKEVNHQASYIPYCDITSDNGYLRVNYVSKKADITLSFKNILNFQNDNDDIAKFFLYLLWAINHRATNRSKDITAYMLRLSVSDIKNTFKYSRNDSAKRAAVKAFRNIRNIEVTGTEIRKHNISSNKYFGLIEMVDETSTKGFIDIRLSQDIEWELLAPQFTVIPKNIYSASSNAFNLAWLIAYTARQNVTEIQKNGYFTLKAKNIAQKLNLPISNTRRFSQYVKEPLEKAIEELEAINQSLDNNYLRITPSDNAANTTGDEYMEKVKFQIEPVGDYKERFVKVANTRAKKKLSAQIRKAKDNTAVRKAKAERIAGKALQAEA